MDIRGFQVWLSAARGLTRAQRREALAVLSGRSEGEASKAAIEPEPVNDFETVTITIY